MNLVDFSEELTTSVHTLYIRVYRITNKCASFLSHLNPLLVASSVKQAVIYFVFFSLPMLDLYLPGFQLYQNEWYPSRENHGI